MVFALILGCSEYALDPKTKTADLAEPDIVIEPASVRFDTIAPYCTSEQTVLVRNVGTAPLDVTGSWVEGDEALTAEWISQVIEPGQGVPVTVRFHPTAGGTAVGSLVVPSDDPDEPEASASVEALADGDDDVIDVYVQQTLPVDVVWVVDNSGSMAQEQARLVADIEEYYVWFDTLGLDYHMGVITTDIVTPTMGGRLQGTPAWVDASVTDGLGVLSAALNVGTEDQGDESGLAAMQLALSEPVLSTENAGFYRPEAHLVIVFLSDEPEQSGVPSSDYIGFLQGLKPDPTLIQVSAIVGDRGAGCASTCDGAPNDAQPGDAYLDVMDAFDGLFGSICTCDLSSILDTLGVESTLYAREFTLSSVPVTSGDVHVYLDGVETLDWTYDAANNRVVFDTPPRDGTRVEILYITPLTCAEEDPATDTGTTDTGTTDSGTTDSGP